MVYNYDLIMFLQFVTVYSMILYDKHICALLYTRRKTFTHEKRDQVGMDLVRSTEAKYESYKHACNNKYSPLQFFIHIYSYYMHVYILYGPCLLFQTKLCDIYLYV